MTQSEHLVAPGELRAVDPQHVASVQELMPPISEVGELADIFGLLSDPGRLRLLISLSVAGELCVRDLAIATGMNESPVSHALRLLRAHRVVEVRRAGRVSYYRLADSHVRLLLELGLQHAQHTTTTDRVLPVVANDGVHQS